MVLSSVASDWVARAEDGTLVMTLRPSYDTDTVSGTMGGKASLLEGGSSVAVSGSPAGEYGQVTGRVGTDGRLSGELNGTVSYRSAIGSTNCFSVTAWTLIPR